jgi:murein endopeptidase
VRSLKLFRPFPSAIPGFLTFALLAGVLGLAPVPARAQSSHAILPDFASCGPDSEATDDLRDGTGNKLEGVAPVSTDFCAEWNPEFEFNGHRCCSKIQRRGGSRRRRRPASKVCTRDRSKPDFCEDVTDEEREYAEAVNSGKIPDVLSYLEDAMGLHGKQAYCTTGNGFLAYGRPVVPTAVNRIMLPRADRCTNYGTDNMVAMLEWAARAAGKEFSDPRYSGLHFLIGDITAPRGGCLAGRSGPVGHASHTNGQDADVGFLTPRPGRESPTQFHTDFDGKANWWLIKQFLKNPYACVKVIFLDKRLIRKLAKAARGDEEWGKYYRYIRHVPGHRNHMHVRIGDGPGVPGCSGGANPEEEPEEIDGAEESVDLEALDFKELKIDGPKPASTSSRLETTQ